MNVQVTTLSLVDGQEQATPSEMGHVFIQAGILSVLVEVSAPLEDWDHVSAELVARAIDTFALSQVNETNTFQVVVNALNDYLLAQNAQLSEEDQLWAGFNAAFIRYNQLFLAQAGPALTYIVSHGVTTHLPQQLKQIPKPLGYAADIECRLVRLTLQPNDRILLTTSHLPTLAPEKMINQVLQDPPEQLIFGLTTLAGKHDFSALVLQYEPRPSQPSSVKPKSVAHQVGRQPVSVYDELRRAATHFTQEKNAMPKNTPQKSTQPVNSTPQAAPQLALLRQLLVALIGLVAWLIGLLSRFIERLNDWLPPRRAAIGSYLDQFTYHFWTLFHRLSHAIKRTLKHVLPGDQTDSSSPRQVSPPTGDGSDFARLLTKLIPIVLLLISIGLWYLKGDVIVNAENNESSVVQPNSEQINSLLIEASAFIQEANNVNEIDAKNLLNLANERLNQAEKLAPDLSQSEQLSRLRQDAQALLIQADKITRPSSMKLVSFTSQNQPSILVSGGDTLFFLEKAKNTIYRLPINSKPLLADAVPPFLTTDQTFGNVQLVGAPELIAWVPGVDLLDKKLIVITTEQQLFDYNTNDNVIRPQPSDLPASPILSAEGYAGNLYLLTSPEKQIWKYEPNSEGNYSSAPIAWLNATGQTQIENPIDMAIDGYIFLLEQNGQVKRFKLGEQSKESFALDTPLSEGVAIAKMAPEQSDLFVADSYRVLRFNQNGHFITEYRAQQGNDWGTIRDISVDEQQQQLYVLSDNGIYVSDLTVNNGN